ncbi:MAG: hypothetical protein JST48_15015 [Bacteroidetes bacterium]|nr:hypothetical protein [Bacteroidota bacterium]
MVRLAAKIISVVFHPLLLATYLVLMLSYFFPAMLAIHPSQLWPVVAFVFGFTFLVPVANLLFFRFSGMISSLQMPTKKERIWPFVFISGIYLFILFLFYFKFQFSINFDKLMAITTSLVVAATLINLFYKVSVHSLAMGGWVGFLLPLLRFSPNLLWPTCAVIVVAGLVISSRLLLNAHTLQQTLVGSVTGVLVARVGMYLLF